MNRDEAVNIIRNELLKFRHKTHAELRHLVGTRIPTAVITGASGAEYQVAIQVHWDGERDGNIRVLGLIDDGGWRAFVPLTEGFIIGPDNNVGATW